MRIVGGDTKAWYGRPTRGEALDLKAHAGIIDYDPSELVITARSGTPVLEIEAALARHDQVLGFEPPVFGPASTLGGVVAAGLAGPARPFAGAVRDHLLGVRILNGKGEVLRFGGTVFKNVAGFDAFRPMCGAMGTLGVILEVSLRVAPKPQCSTWLRFSEDWTSAARRLNAALARPIPIDGAFHHHGRLHVRLSGPAGGVRAAARELGGEADDPSVWEALRHMTLPPLSGPRLWRLSLPMTAKLDEVDPTWLIDWAGGQRWLAAERSADQIGDIARGAGGHATLFRGAQPGEAVFSPLTAPLFELHKRLKTVFDPAGVLNPGRLYEGL